MENKESLIFKELNKSIDDLDISVRCKEVLKKMGYYNLFMLLRAFFNDEILVITKYRNFGKKSFSELKYFVDCVQYDCNKIDSNYTNKGLFVNQDYMSLNEQLSISNVGSSIEMLKVPKVWIEEGIANLKEQYKLIEESRDDSDVIRRFEIKAEISVLEKIKVKFKN